MSEDQIPVTPDIAATTSAADDTSTDSDAWGTWLKWFALAVLVLVVGWVSILVIQSARSAAARSRFKAQLGRVSLAIQQYEQQYGAFPPAYTVGKDGQPLHSWRALLLPLLGHEDVYQNLRLDEPWNSPHNSQLHHLRPDVFGHPWFTDSLPGEAHVLGIVGPETIWPERYCAKLADVVDGASNSLQLVGHSEADIHWMEPRDLRSADVFDKVFVPANPAVQAWSVVPVAFVDGNVRFVRQSIDRTILRSLISIHGGAPLAGVDLPPAPLEELRELRPVRPAADFRRTEVSPVLDTPLTENRNLIYCATFQIAWDQWRDRTKRSLHSDTISDLVNKLNQSRFDRRNLAADSYVTESGSEADVPKFLERLRTRKMGGKLSNDLQSVPVFGFFLYAALSKQMPFAVKFDRLDDQLTFKSGQESDPVASFGILGDPTADGRTGQLVRQVEVLNHVSDDDFIVKLHTRLWRDEIFLAKIAPSQTLAATLQSAQARIAKPVTNGFRTTIGEGDVLLIPVLELSIAKEFDELNRLKFHDSQHVAHSIFQATQTIQFRLDEAGAIVESETLIIGDYGPSEYDPKKARKLTFDRPFLLWLQERNASAPYLVAWVANSEWMETRRPQP
ncbi:MAG: hypothetical protein JWN70_2153 [Planctomycetaceae bacterium]|nr:hypothetical protein [Planctomycetaceae bacterium]